MAEGGGLLKRVGPSNHIRSHSSKPGFIEVLRRQRAQHTAASCLILDGPVAIWVSIPQTLPRLQNATAGGAGPLAGMPLGRDGAGRDRSLPSGENRSAGTAQDRVTCLGFFCSRIETNYYFDDPGAP